MSKPIYVGDVVRCYAEFYGTKTITAASASGDTLTSAAHGFTDGQQVLLRVAGGSLPLPLIEDTFYYISARATDTFKLAPTPAGTAIDLTDAGSGFMEVLGLMDPATVSNTTELPDGSEVTYTYAGSTITKALVGIYYKDFTATLAGPHDVRFVTTGNPSVVLQYSFDVLPNNT